MKNNAVRNILYAQVCFFTFALTSFIIQPQGLRLNDGMSYWTTHFPGVLTFAWGIILCAFFTYRASLSFNGASSSPQAGWTSLAFKSMAILMPLVVLTPYTINFLFYDSHVAVSSTLFSIQFALSIYLTFSVKRDWLNVLLIILQTGSGLSALLSLPDYLLLETPSQLAFQIAFAILIVRSLPAVQTAPVKLTQKN